MAICANCGTQGTRIRSRWNDKNVQLPDECPHCAPQSFDKFTAPSDKKIWMGYEAHPNEYIKAADGGFDRKPEYRAEQESSLCQSTPEEIEAEQRAIALKRATRRTAPMDAAEYAQALAKAEQIATAIIESANRGNIN